MIHLHKLERTIKERGGFIIKEDMKWLLFHCPNRQVLVRCNLNRFLCPVHELEVRMERVAQNPDDYVRDVSLPTSDVIWRD